MAVTSITLEGLRNAVASDVTVAKQIAAGTATAETLTGLQNKIGRIVTLKGEFADPLTEMDGDSLEYGKTVEEYFMKLKLPDVWTGSETDALAPAYQEHGTVYYNYVLDRNIFTATVPTGRLQAACLNAADYANMVAEISKDQKTSESLYTYQSKLQMIGNLASKALATTHAANLTSAIAVPTDTATGEAFLKELKTQVELAGAPSENSSVSGETILPATGFLRLFMLQGINPSLDVDTLAGAINPGKLDPGVSVRTVANFGSTYTSKDAAEGVYAVLADIRGLKLCSAFQFADQNNNGKAGFTNFFDHRQFTAFISAYTYVHVFKKPV